MKAPELQISSVLKRAKPNPTPLTCHPFHYQKAVVPSKALMKNFQSTQQMGQQHFLSLYRSRKREALFRHSHFLIIRAAETEFSVWAGIWAYLRSGAKRIGYYLSTLML